MANFQMQQPKTIDGLAMVPGMASAGQGAGTQGGNTSAPVAQSKDIPALLNAARDKIHAKERHAALQILKQIEAIEPNNADLKHLTASIHVENHRFDLAVVPLMEVLALNPKDTTAYANLGAIMSEWGERAAAIDLFRKALECDHTNIPAASRLIFTSLRLARWDFWPQLPGFFELLSNATTHLEPGIFLSMSDDPLLQLEKAKLFSETRVTKLPVTRPAPRQRAEGDKIRIGYFTSDVFAHATMWLIGRMFALHDSDKFEIFLYNYSRTNDDKSKEIITTVDHHRFVKNMTDAQVIELAQQDGIDIAVDLKGFTSGGRLGLVANETAPVTVSYLGFPGTLGRKDLDYIVADDVMVPSELRKFYSEKIMYMPNCYQVTDNKRPIAETTPSRTELGLPEDALVLCSFNNTYKITPVEFDIWMRVMQQVENSVFWHWAPEEQARDNMRMEAEKRGVSGDRLIFCDSAPQAEHLARMQQADLFLDSFNVCAHTTASDSLWAGVPIVTMQGKQFAARVASSILHAFDMPELITYSPEEYEARILELAQNPDQLKAVKEKVAEKRETSALFDTEQFTRNWEAMLERALLRAESGLKPDDLHL